MELARSLAHLFLELPAEQLSFARLDAVATSGWAHDAGALDHVSGEPMGEELAPWLRLVTGPGGRSAFLDVDLDALGLIMRATRRAQERGRR